MNKIAIFLFSENALPLAEILRREWAGSVIYSKNGENGTVVAESMNEAVETAFDECELLVFIGAMGICVRMIAPFVRDKHTDPAVVSLDSTGRYAVSVLSGHIGGANEWTRHIARITGAEAVVSTASDNRDLWALDTLAGQFGWIMAGNTSGLNGPIAAFVSRKPTALLLDVRDKGTGYLERTRPEHVAIFYQYADIDLSGYELLIAVTPYVYPDAGIRTVTYHPKVLHLGIGCRKDCNPAGIPEYLRKSFRQAGLAIESIRDISTIDLKKDEPLVHALHNGMDVPVHIYTAHDLQGIDIPNPSEKVREVTGVPGVAEATAIQSAAYGPLVLEKQKAGLQSGAEFTFAVAFDRNALREGHIEIVGAGPGDPDLVSVRGRQFLEAADLILYAGSLVPVELTHCAKPGAVVRSSASLTLEEQFGLMKLFYDKGKLVVRLHTGDPCIYGAIQEQMAFFDEHGMSYHITPGISSFQAAAAALRSQFTIPEKVQTIILTRGEGATPMPEREKLHLLARSQSTMCIFLSAAVVENVQQELLVHYPPETPVAACYKLTWKDERIYRGKLGDLAKIVKENNLTLTTMIVVGEAIDNRAGLSKLYSGDFKHLFRK